MNRMTFLAIIGLLLLPSASMADRITICEEGYVFQGKLIDSKREINDAISQMTSTEVSLAVAGEVSEPRIDKIKSLLVKSGKKVAEDDPLKLQGGCPVIGNDY